jgi:ubiquitin carboxyl-terminal hydrolase 3
LAFQLLRYISRHFVSDCLKKFTDVEELADSERFFCSRCGRKQASTKKFWIRRLPNVLCLHLKRFRWSTWSRTKLDTQVDFPLRDLDMSDFLLSNLHETRCSNAASSLYDLAAVIVHHGSGYDLIEISSV